MNEEECSHLLGVASERDIMANEAKLPTLRLLLRLEIFMS